MKYFISDIHGELNGLEQLLKYTKIDLTKDQLVFGGDYINRGKESGKVLMKIKQLIDTYPKKM
ncbi:metallophosphoesterase [Paenibacillus alvei]|uniref:Metallophosphoesterase n=1 Tax=Paenibacillus alvei TaxID=44250 RepID=A0A383R6N2_PAEAL